MLPSRAVSGVLFPVATDQALVDEDLLSLLEQYTWCLLDGYARMVKDQTSTDTSTDPV
jgi:hypothetical protein